MAFSLTDWFARTFYISAEDEATANQVKAGQQAILERQRAEGLGSLEFNAQNQKLINDSGTAYFDEQLGKPGFGGLPGTVPWWIWLLVGAAVLFYLWPGLVKIFGRGK